jgi:hypothetical protein
LEPRRSWGGGLDVANRYRSLRSWLIAGSSVATNNTYTAAGNQNCRQKYKKQYTLKNTTPGNFPKAAEHTHDFPQSMSET